MCKEQYVSDSFDGVFRDTYIVDLMGTIAFTHEGVSPTTHSNRLYPILMLLVSFTDPMLPESYTDDDIGESYQKSVFTQLRGEQSRHSEKD